MEIRDDSSCVIEPGNSVLSRSGIRPEDALRRYLYLTVQRMLYLLFGVPSGVSIEVGAVAASAILIFLVRKCRPAFAITLAGAVCIIVADTIWWIWVSPANSATSHIELQKIYASIEAKPP
jgi:hypothetical protein